MFCGTYWSESDTCSFRLRIWLDLIKTNDSSLIYLHKTTVLAEPFFDRRSFNQKSCRILSRFYCACAPVGLLQFRTQAKLGGLKLFFAAKIPPVLEAATSCTQAKRLFRGSPRLFRVNSVLRDCLRGSAKPVLGELRLWVKGHPYSVRFCKSLDANLTEITAKYPLMKTR